jgi:hypothetical protein
MEEVVKAKIMVCFVIAPLLFAQSADKMAAGKFKAVIMDLSGAVISNARVIIHRDWPNEDVRDLQLNTDQTGGLSVDLAPGFYDVAIFAHSLSPSVGKVRIKASRVTNYKAQLPPDPQILAEFGNIFQEATPATSQPKP